MFSLILTKFDIFEGLNRDLDPHFDEQLLAYGCARSSDATPSGFAWELFQSRIRPILCDRLIFERPRESLFFGAACKQSYTFAKLARAN
jgi:hypothetical protein